MSPSIPTDDDTGCAVLRDNLGCSRFSTVMLIRRYDGCLAVKKSYQPGEQARFRREVRALRELAALDRHGVIPPLLEVGDDYFVIPYYSDSLRKSGFLWRLGYQVLPLHVAKRVFHSLRHFYDNGWELLDTGTLNVIHDEAQGTKLIDFEYAYPGLADPGVPFEESPTVRGHHLNCENGPASDNTSPWWNRLLHRGHYEISWFRGTALSLNSLLYDPLWLQQIKRFLNISFTIPVLMFCRLVSRGMRRIRHFVHQTRYSRGGS